MAPPKATSHGDGAGAAGGGGALTERSTANPTLVDRPKASITAEASVFTNLPPHSRDSPAKNRRRRPRPPGPNADNSQCLVLRSRPSRFGKQIAEAIDYFLGKSPKSETKKNYMLLFCSTCARILIPAMFQNKPLPWRQRTQPVCQIGRTNGACALRLATSG